jgi:myosin heavy subunit
MSGYFGSLLTGLFGWGSDEAETDDSISRKSVRKKIFKAEQDISEAAKGVEECRDEYHEHIQKGVNASASRRRVHAIRARIAKFKANIYRLKRLKAIKSLSTWEVKDGMDEVKELMADMQESPEVSDIIDMDPEKLEERISDTEAQIAAEFQGMDDVMGALDIDTSGISLETTEEEELMNELAKGNLDMDDLDFDEDEMFSEDESDDFEAGLDFGSMS